MSLFKMSKTIIRNLFSKPATLMYPIKPREFTPNTRGHINIETDTCIYCGLCQRKCPTGAITVNKADKKWEIDRLRCIMCNCCSEVCPKKSLSMHNKYSEPTAVRGKDTF